MTTVTPESPAALACHRCGYDLRTQPADGVCPECGEPVAESARLAAIPVRPAWRDSDPRWRRRMLAGIWVMALLPIFAVLREFGWAAQISMPGWFDGPGGSHTLDRTFLLDWIGIDPWPTFLIGVPLLFAKERFRRRNRLDWTRRWGLLFCCLVLVLGIVFLMPVVSLVMIGIAALFFTLPLTNQPAATEWLAAIGGGYARLGLVDIDVAASSYAVAAAASLSVLVAATRIAEALRATGLRFISWLVVAPLIGYAAFNGASVVLMGIEVSAEDSLPHFPFLFSPVAIAITIARPEGSIEIDGWFDLAISWQSLNWLIVLAIALWLTVAQIRSWRPRPEPA